MPYILDEGISQFIGLKSEKREYTTTIINQLFFIIDRPVQNILTDININEDKDGHLLTNDFDPTKKEAIMYFNRFTERDSRYMDIIKRLNKDVLNNPIDDKKCILTYSLIHIYSLGDMKDKLIQKLGASPENQDFLIKIFLDLATKLANLKSILNDARDKLENEPGSFVAKYWQYIFRTYPQKMNLKKPVYTIIKRRQDGSVVNPRIWNIPDVGLNDANSIIRGDANKLAFKLGYDNTPEIIGVKYNDALNKQNITNTTSEKDALKTYYQYNSQSNENNIWPQKSDLKTPLKMFDELPKQLTFKRNTQEIHTFTGGDFHYGGTTITNKEISYDFVEKIKDEESDLVFLALGQSGSGKTSTLVYFSGVPNASPPIEAQDGVILELLNHPQFKNKFTNIDVTIDELFDYNVAKESDRISHKWPEQAGGENPPEGNDKKFNFIGQTQDGVRVLYKRRQNTRHGQFITANRVYDKLDDEDKVKTKLNDEWANTQSENNGKITVGRDPASGDEIIIDKKKGMTKNFIKGIDPVTKYARMEFKRLRRYRRFLRNRNLYFESIRR